MVWHDLSYTQAWLSEEGQEFENFSKKGCFLICNKNNFTSFGPPRETAGKSTVGPLGEFLPMPMHASM